MTLLAELLRAQSRILASLSSVLSTSKGRSTLGTILSTLLALCSPRLRTRVSLELTYSMAHELGCTALIIPNTSEAAILTALSLMSTETCEEASSPRSYYLH